GSDGDGTGGAAIANVGRLGRPVDQQVELPVLGGDGRNDILDDSQRSEQTRVGNGADHDLAVSHGDGVVVADGHDGLAGEAGEGLVVVCEARGGPGRLREAVVAGSDGDDAGGAAIANVRRLGRPVDQQVELPVLGGDGRNDILDDSQ